MNIDSYWYSCVVFPVIALFWIAVRFIYCRRAGEMWILAIGCVFDCIMELLVSVPFFLDGETLPGIVWGALAGFNAWLAWRNRPPRKRKPSKALAKVRDLGHRLVLVPS